MSGDELKKRIKAWAREVGTDRAKLELVSRRIGLSTVQKLIAGKYESTPKGRVAEALEDILKNTA